MAISAVGEGCHKQMEALLPQIMDGVIQYLQDPVSTITNFIIICNLLRISHKLIRQSYSFGYDSVTIVAN